MRDAGLLAPDEQGLSSKLEALSSKSPEALSSNPPALSSKPPDGDDELPGWSAKFDEVLRRTLLDNLPGSLAVRLVAIGQRHPPQEVRDLVLALCRLRDWRVDELSAVLRRNPEVVRQNYLRPLMRDGRLVMTIPNEPNNPQQAYRTGDGEASG